MSALETTIDQNTGVFVDGIKVLEMQQQVAFRAMQDSLNGRVRVKNVTTDENGIAHAAIDFDSYISEQLAGMQKNEEAAEKREEPTEPLLHAADTDEPVIFGGSH